MDIDWQAVMATEGFGIWIRIMQWVWAACVLWVFVLLLRGGFTDMTEIIRSPYATAGERGRMILRLPTRFLLLIVAALFGATSFALPVFLQGAVALFLWRQATGG